MAGDQRRPEPDNEVPDLVPDLDVTEESGDAVEGGVPKLPDPG